MGSAARYGLALWLNEAHALTRFFGIPVRTLLANWIGAFLLSALSAYFLRNQESAQNAQLFLTVGFCGGFTTYSTMNHETVLMLQRGDYANAAIYLAATFVGALIFGFAGFALAR